MVQAQRKGQQSEASTPAGSPGSSLPGFAPASADLLSLLLIPASDSHPPQPLQGKPVAPHSVSPAGTLSSTSQTPVDTTRQSTPAASCLAAEISDKTRPAAADGNAIVPDAAQQAVQRPGELDRPYLRLDKGITVGKLQQYVAGRLSSQHAERAQHGPAGSPSRTAHAAASGQQWRVRLQCKGQALPEASTLNVVAATNLHEPLLVLQYQQSLVSS